MWNVQCVSLVDMTRFASFRTQTIAEVPCHVIFFCEALYRWHGTYAFFCFFHFTDDMGVFVFWVCSTTPMSSAGTIDSPGPCGAKTLSCSCNPGCRLLIGNLFVARSVFAILNFLNGFFFLQKHKWCTCKRVASNSGCVVGGPWTCGRGGRAKTQNLPWHPKVISSVRKAIKLRRAFPMG